MSHSLQLPAQYLPLKSSYSYQPLTAGNFACLPPCLVDYKIQLGPTMYLPSGFLDWRRNLKALMFIHKSSCEETNLPQQNCFSRFFVCLKSAFVFYYFDYLPCALVNNENTETFTTAKLIAKLIAQKCLAPFLRHVYTICLMRKQTSTPLQE